MEIKQYSLEEILKMDNSRPIVTPEQKFKNLQIRQNGNGRVNKFRKFHFKAIKCGAKAHVFNGIGELVTIVDNSVKGIREARVHCLELFTKTTPEKLALLKWDEDKRNHIPQEYYSVRRELVSKVVESEIAYGGGYKFDEVE